MVDLWKQTELQQAKKTWLKAQGAEVDEMQSLCLPRGGRDETNQSWVTAVVFLNAQLEDDLFAFGRALLKGQRNGQKKHLCKATGHKRPCS